MERSLIHHMSKPIAVLFAMALGLGISGCQVLHNEVVLLPEPIPEPAAMLNYTVVRTFFATDRLHTNSEEPSQMFGDAGRELLYGVCEVSMPPDHDPGRLESPSVWRLEFRESPEKHVVLLGAKLKPKNEFYTGLAERVGQSKGKNALVFIHGYNVSFEDAARRTAQMAYDLEFDGASIFYSWPSKAQELLYTVDRQTLERSTPKIKTFLADIFSLSNAENVYIVAHSMGNQGLTKALVELRNENPKIKKQLKELILAAPDIDVGVFKEQIAPGLIAAAQNVTLYASSRDKALAVSRRVNGEYRLGDTGDGVTVTPGVETIDASSVDTDFLGHSYIGNSKSVVIDLATLIRYQTRAAERFRMKVIENESGTYWQFKP